MIRANTFQSISSLLYETSQVFKTWEACLPGKYITGWTWVLVTLLGTCIAPGIGRAQDCFEVHTAQSEVVLSTTPAAPLPTANDTLKLPCTKLIQNFAFKIKFKGNSEKYFEDSTQFLAVLAYKSSTYLLVYDKPTNQFKISNNQQNLREGSYSLTVSSIMCTPNNLICDNCTIHYNFEVVYVEDPDLSVTIQADPSPAVLTCLPGSSVSLVATALPHIGFQAQWSHLDSGQYVNIPGANTTEYTTTTAGTYRYTLSGPAGCTASNFTTVSTPVPPAISLTAPEQTLDACVQVIAGVDVQGGGAPANLELLWTTTGSGILLSGQTTPTPVVAALGAYSLLATNLDNGCTATATVQIVPGNIPTVIAQVASTTGIDVLDCQTPTRTLQASASLSSGGASSYTYTWSTGVSGSEILVDAPGIYSVTATSTDNGCQGAADILIFTDYSAPDLQIISPRDTVCAGQNISLTALALEPVTYRWQNNSTTSVLLVLPAQNGPTAYTVTVTANDNGCTTSTTKIIERVDPPQIACPMDALTVQTGGQATLDCPITGGELIWLAVSTNMRNIPPSGTGPVGLLFELADAQAPGTVEYAFFAKNAGCTSDRNDMRLTVLPESVDGIFFPELITPNGDGQNDNWGIVVPESISNPDAYQLSLFNRYGALVWEANLVTPFHADNYPDGTYYYVLSKPDGGQTRGAVTILRRK